MNATKPVVISFSFLVILLFSCTVFAENGKAVNELELTTEKVIIFKDGYTLVVKRAKATTNENGEVFTSEVPDAAVLGSFWATPREGELTSMTAGWVEATEESEKIVTCSQIIEVLDANVGKACQIELKDDTSLSGEIANVLAQRGEQVVQASTHEQHRFSSFISASSMPATVPTSTPAPVETMATMTGTHFVVKTDQGDVLVPASDVKRLMVNDMSTTIARKVKTTTRTKRLTFRFATPNVEREMLIMYFRPGVRWIPTYRINLEEDSKTAEISMQAEIINEAEDLIDMPVDIVVGVPNFRFRNTTSPLVLEQTMRNALAQADPNLMGNFRNDFSNSLYTQLPSNVRRDGAEAAGAIGEGAVQLPGELTASGAQDLFVYSLPRLSLKKGERCSVGILTTEVPYRDVYTWDLHIKKFDAVAVQDQSAAQSPLAISKNKVWRQIELINNTNLPWTTGAAMIMRDQQPLAQELLTYTSPKDYCRVPVTVSIDTRGSFEEEEIARELNALSWEGYHYAKITNQTKLDLCNNKNEDVNVEITVRFGGKVDEVSNEGNVTMAPYRSEDWHQYHGHPAVNYSSTVRWKVKLEPGETFEPKINYHFFVRR